MSDLSCERLVYKWMLRRDGQLVTAVRKKPWPVVRLESGS